MEKSYLDNDMYGGSDREYTDSKARKVCITSLILRYAVPVVMCVSFGLIILLSADSTNGLATSGILFVPSMLVFVSYIMSWVFMIKVRLRRKDFRFGKILMWLYIADTLLVIFGMILQLVLYFIKAGLI